MLPCKAKLLTVGLDVLFPLQQTMNFKVQLCLVRQHHLPALHRGGRGRERHGEGQRRPTACLHHARARRRHAQRQENLYDDQQVSGGEHRHPIPGAGLHGALHHVSAGVFGQQ